MTFGYEYLQEIIQRKNSSVAQMAAELGISPQAVSGWRESIPAKRVIQLSKLFALTSQDVDLLLGVEPLLFEFRTRRGDELDDSQVSARTKVRAEIIFERFFGNTHEPSNYDLSALRKKIEEAKGDFQEIAKHIRTEFELPKYLPLTNESLNLLLDRIGVRAFFLPFKAIGLSQEEDSQQTAILFKKEGRYSILLDSDRTLDEAHFDKLHEFIHILLDALKVENRELESLIDKVCGELIYPRQYIVEKYFDGDESSKPIKNREKLRQTFGESNRNLKFILSPRGLARAMRDAGLATHNSELFKYFDGELHTEHRNFMSKWTYSSVGSMDFDFSNRDALLSFYRHIANSLSGPQYPLFEKLKEDVVSGALSTADFADTFGLSAADAIVIAAIWKSGEHELRK